MSRSILFVPALLVAVAPLLAPKTPAVRSIFDDPLPPRAREAEPFRPVRVPAWVQDTVGCGYCLSVSDAATRKEAAKHGVTISEVNFVDPFYAYYDSKHLKRRSPHVPADRVAKEVAEYKRLGVRVLAVYPPTLQAEVYEAHRDWRRIATDTTVVPETDMKKFPHGGMLCLLGPYGDFMIDVLADILTKHPDVDAFSFDGLHHGGVCYCEHCRKNYRKDAKAEIPKVDIADPAYRRYLRWADSRLEALVRKMQTRLKGIKPDAALVTWTTNAGRFGHLLDVPRNMPARLNLLFDAPDQEFWMDETNRGATVLPAFANAWIWATTNHRVAFSEPYLLSHGNPYGKDSFPAHEVLCRMMLALTHGASPSIALAQPSHLKRGLFDAMDEVNARKPWLTHKTPEPWAAIVVSDDTRNWYGRSPGKVEERYLASVLGTFRACLEAHLPVTLLADWNISAEQLAKYKVVILPNTACLSDAQVKAIGDYVRNGGGLVATSDVGLFDGTGEAREGFALGDVLGVTYRGLIDAGVVKKDELDVNFAKTLTPEYWDKRRNVFDFRLAPGSFLDRGKLPTHIGRDPVTFKGPALRVAATGKDARIVGTIRPKGGSADSPAIVLNEHGKGRAVYLAAGFDSAYYLYPYPYQRLILEGAIRHAAGDAKLPVEVAAPMCVQAVLMRQAKKGERLVLHLFNNVNTTAHMAHPADDVPLREETLPVRDVVVTFAPGYRVKRVHLEPGGKDLDATKTPAGTRVVVPRVDVHAIVVAELE